MYVFEVIFIREKSFEQHLTLDYAEINNHFNKNSILSKLNLYFNNKQLYLWWNLCKYMYLFMLKIIVNEKKSKNLNTTKTQQKI